MKPHQTSIVALALGSLLCAASAVAAQQASAPTDVARFITALDRCAPASANTPHPLMPAFVVEHAVTGVKPETCAYTQTMPGRMKMFCALSAEGRHALSADLAAMTSGARIQGGTSASQPVWMKECEIELPTGVRIPAVQSRAPR